MGTYRIMQWRSIEPEIAINNHGLTQKPTTNKDESSLKAFNAFNISITTNTDNDKVEAFCLPRMK